MGIKIFSTKGFRALPERGEYFRVGWWLGNATVVTPWFIVMTRARNSRGA